MGDCFGKRYLDLRKKLGEENMFCGIEDLRYASDGHLVRDNQRFSFIYEPQSHT